MKEKEEKKHNSPAKGEIGNILLKNNPEDPPDPVKTRMPTKTSKLDKIL